MIVNLDYLDSLQEVENKFNFILEEGEKAVFVTSLQMFGNQKGHILNSSMMSPPFTLTNKKIYIRGDVLNNIVWVFDLRDDVQEIRWLEKRSLKIFKLKCYNVYLKRELKYKESLGSPGPFGKPKIVEHTLSEVELFFKDEDLAAFGEIVDNLNR